MLVRPVDMGIFQRLAARRAVHAVNLAIRTGNQSPLWPPRHQIRVNLPPVAVDTPMAGVLQKFFQMQGGTPGFPGRVVGIALDRKPKPMPDEMQLLLLLPLLHRVPDLSGRCEGNPHRDNNQQHAKVGESLFTLPP